MARKSKLKNGLKIVTERNKNVETIIVSVGVKVGSRYENKNEIGLSHALEHMLFKGTKTRTAEELSETVDFVGAQTNAYTTEEQTVYYIKGLKDHLEMAIDLLSDQVLNSIFPAEEMAKEMEVIEQEIKMYLDDIGDMAQNGFKQIAFSGSPLEHPIIGNAAQVLSYKPQNMLDYYAKHYRCKNMVLSVSGNVRHQDVVELAKKYFVDNETYKKSKIKRTAWNPGQKLVHDESKNQVTVILAWPVLGREDTTLQERTVSKIMDTILSSGMSSKLIKEIREKRGLVYGVGSQVHHYEELGYFMIMGGTDHNKVEEFFEATALVLKNFNKDLIERDLLKAKNDMKATLCMSIENTANVAMGNISSIQNFGRPMNLKAQLEAIENVSIDDVKEAMKKILLGKPVLSLYGYCPQINFENKPISIDKFEAMLR